MEHPTLEQAFLSEDEPLEAYYTKHIDVLCTSYLEVDTSRRGQIWALIFISDNHICVFNIHIGH